MQRKRKSPSISVKAHEASIKVWQDTLYAERERSEQRQSAHQAELVKLKGSAQRERTEAVTRLMSAVGQTVQAIATIIGETGDIAKGETR